MGKQRSTKHYTKNQRLSNTFNIGWKRTYMDVVEWSRVLDVRLREWCCSVSMVWVQIPSREEQKFDSSKISDVYIYIYIYTSEN